MGFEIRIEGLDEAIKELEKLEKGISLEELTFWCNRISNDIKLNHPDLSDRIILTVSLNEEGDSQFRFEIPTEIKSEAVNAIRNYLGEMPITTSAIFESLIKILEERAEKLNEK